MQKRNLDCDSPYPQKKKIIKKTKPKPKPKAEIEDISALIELENCPKVENIKDLITIGKTLKFYKNINIIMLWDILPHLIDLDNMIGLKAVKETIFYQIIYYLQGMHLKNYNEEYLHTVIFGSPGSGKTTLAKIIGLIYKNLGILSKKGDFNIATREDFIGEHLGSTAIKTSNLLRICLGGVLFIDEIYSIGPGQKDKDSFSKEAIDTICSFLSEHKNDFCCIIAGYEDEVKRCFFSVNPGLERRFPWIHIIDEYSDCDLTDIFIQMISKMKWGFHSEVDKEFLVERFNENQEYFSNSGGDIENFITKIKMIHSKRVFSLPRDNKFLINKEDIIEAIKIVKKYKLNKNDIKYEMYT